MSDIVRSEIAARGSLAVDLQVGSTLRVVNTFGAQVVAAWAFVPPDMQEHMSMEHTRIHAKSSRPRIETVFYTNMHRPVLEIVADSSPGVHDWYLAACNQQRFALLGHEGEHANCTDNMHAALAERGLSAAYVPCPLNLFENVSFLFSEPMEIKDPVAMPGDYVSLKALIDCTVVLSACPQDILATNGPDHEPRSVEIEIAGP